MDKNIYIQPSFYAHILNGFFTFIAIVVVIMNYSKIKSLDYYRWLVLFLLLSIALGVHGLSHLGMETSYDYNPLETK